MLTPLQRRIASVVAGVPEAQQFALASGAALIARVKRRHGRLEARNRPPLSELIKGLGHVTPKVPVA